MALDLSTGVEIELVLPEGMGRLDLLEALRLRLGGTVEPFLFPSKVPVPRLPSAAATIALIQDIARRHQAAVHSVAPDFAHFYLAHRAGRLRDPAGAPALSVVHDNTLAGGERVAEVVTRPFLRGELPWLREVVGVLASIPGVELPDTAALHVHVDGAPFEDAARLGRLVVAFERVEPALRVLARTPSGLRRARSLPAGLGDTLAGLAAAGAPWPAVAAALGQQVPDRGFALNLYNLAAGDPAKRTVELKLAASTVDPARVAALRELVVAFAASALDPAPGLPLPVEPLALAARLLPEPELARALADPV